MAHAHTQHRYDIKMNEKELTKLLNTKEKKRGKFNCSNQIDRNYGNQFGYDNEKRNVQKLWREG